MFRSIKKNLGKQNKTKQNKTKQKQKKKKEEKKKEMVKYILFNVLLFLIGTIGIFLVRKNIIVILMCLEMILLSINLNFITFSVYLDDFIGQVFSLFVLTVAAAEAAIGLAILVTYYRVKGSIATLYINSLKG